AIPGMVYEGATRHATTLSRALGRFSSALSRAARAARLSAPPPMVSPSPARSTPTHCRALASCHRPYERGPLLRRACGTGDGTAELHGDDDHAARRIDPECTPDVSRALQPTITHPQCCARWL